MEAVKGRHERLLEVDHEEFEDGGRDEDAPR